MTFCYLCNEKRRILWFFCIILRRPYYGTRKPLSATAFLLHFWVLWEVFTNHPLHFGKHYPPEICVILRPPARSALRHAGAVADSYNFHSIPPRSFFTISD